MILFRDMNVLLSIINIKSTSIKRKGRIVEIANLLIATKNLRTSRCNFNKLYLLFPNLVVAYHIIGIDYIIV